MIRTIMITISNPLKPLVITSNKKLQVVYNLVEAAAILCLFKMAHFRTEPLDDIASVIQSHTVLFPIT